MESYVLGLASDEERREFEQYCARYPELVRAREDFELSLEKQAMAHAVQPDASLKNRILAEAGISPVIPVAPPVRRINGWKYAAAACIALLAGSLYLNLNLSRKNNALKGEYQQVKAELGAVKKDVEMLRSSPDIKMAAMKGTLEAPLSYSTVYWDTTSHDVYLLISNLPKPADSLQYQLWAFADGKPVDLGFISDDYFVRQDKLLLKAKNAQRAEAFAISLEKKGRPDVSTPAGQVYMVGNLQ